MSNLDLDKCSICYDNLNNDISYKLDCNHIFHKNCLITALQYNSVCPYCRINIKYDHCSNCWNKNFLVKTAACMDGIKFSIDYCYKWTCKDRCEFLLNCGCIKKIKLLNYKYSTIRKYCKKCKLATMINLEWYGNDKNYIGINI